MRRALSLLAATAGGVLAWHAGADSAERPAPQPVAAAHARTAKPAKRTLWASINKCDTRANPDTVGVRGSMPGLGRKRSVAAMRFRVQFRRADGTWADAGPDARSGWKRLGTVATATLEAGQDFTFEPPAGGEHVLRGVVEFRWTRRGEVVRKRKRVTAAGHRSSAGGDPADYSAATCTIS